MENTELSMVEARRGFLKKMAYVAPAVVALGALNAQASVGVAASTFNGQIFTVDADGVKTQIGTATVTGQSGPKVIHDGATVRLSTGEVTNYDAAGVQANSNGWFSWAKKYFPQINL